MSSYEQELQVPKHESEIIGRLGEIGLGLRYRKDLRSWQVFRLANEESVAVRGSYGTILGQCLNILETQ